MPKHHKQSSSHNSEPADDLYTSLGIDKTIILVGLMGVGKTTVGRRLARKLGLKFVDSDEEIEIAADMSVADIFDTFGEEYFRSGERRVITRLLASGPQIVATGGGAFINAETRAIIKQAGLSVWLDADLDVLVERTGRRNTRPLLKQGDPAQILAKLAKERAPIYAEADIKIKSSVVPHDHVVDSIITALETYSKADDCT
ncbi:MAG: shikimate kinase [Kordiimonadaceae bacterium]|nr:shikimate kinase [Kordiimonadaceae bacterium]